MAHAELTPLILSRATKGSLSTANTVAFDSATGAYIDFFDSAQNNQSGRLILMATASTKNSTELSIYLKVLTSTNKAFTGSGQDDLTLTFSQSTKPALSTEAQSWLNFVGPVETARYLDTDQRINLRLHSTLATATYVYVSAIVIP